MGEVAQARRRRPSEDRVHRRVPGAPAGAPAGFNELNWCETGHQGYVLRGEFTIHFDNRSVPCRPGMGFVIPGDERHRSQGSESESTVVYVIDEVPAP